MFWSSTGFDPNRDLVDLRNRVAIVTGGNRGIGYATIQHLARAGARVYMAARDEKKAKTAIETLQRQGLSPGNGEIHWLKLDLSDPRATKAAAEEFISKEKRLDVLVNNAAVVSSSFEKTRDGPSNIVTVNYLSPFVFTETLLPLLISTARESESDLTSSAHSHTPMPVKFEKVDDLCMEYSGKFMSGFFRYAHTKLLDILWTKHLQKRLDSLDIPAPIIAVAIHPGVVDTVTPSWPLPWLWGFLSRLLLGSNNPERGSYNSVFAAASKAILSERHKYKGAYLESHPIGYVTSPIALAEDEVVAQNLFTLTQSVLHTIELVS
uniref:NAD(P)-binding protein n=1 Tax=Moniliophthora roreri TaxID=221103 RepID=A0A0W0GAI6_MONRR